MFNIDTKKKADTDWQMIKYQSITLSGMKQCRAATEPEGNDNACSFHLPRDG